MNPKTRPSYTGPVRPAIKVAAYQPLPLSDATLRMIDQAIANDQAGILGRKFDLTQYKDLLEEEDDE